MRLHKNEEKKLTSWLESGIQRSVLEKHFHVVNQFGTNAMLLAQRQTNYFKVFFLVVKQFFTTRKKGTYTSIKNAVHPP